MPLRPYVQTRVPTKRQLEILALSAHGLTYDQVAAELHMSHYTVKSQIRGLCKRINARNLPNAIAICFVQGWLVPNSPP